MTELEKHKGNYHVESLLVDDFDMIPSSTMLETNGRIKQNLKDIDFSYDSDDDVEWQPDPTEKFSPVEKAQNKKKSQVENSQVPSTQSGTDKVFECQDCDYVSKWAHNVRRHSNIKHNTTKRKRQNEQTYETRNKRCKT